jgi:quercetin dioxygenase-like cupin family protein
MIRYLQLPFQYDSTQLQREVADLQRAWYPHFNRQHYEGNWEGLSLRAPGGKADTLLVEALGEEVPCEDTPLLDQCPYIQSTLRSLECPQTSVRLLKLRQGAVIKEHIDAGLFFEKGEARLHIPICTHPEVEFYLDGDRVRMETGSCWYINAGLPHRLANPSPQDRIHLVVDCVVNAWLKDLFARTDLPVRSIKDTGEQDRRRIKEVIAELRRSADPDRLDLADRLEQQKEA